MCDGLGVGPPSETMGAAFPASGIERADEPNTIRQPLMSWRVSWLIFIAYCVVMKE